MDEKAIKGRHTSRRLSSNNADGIERRVLAAIPGWRRLPRCVRVVYGALGRYGSLAECLADFQEDEDFALSWGRHVGDVEDAELREFAAGWYERGELPKAGKTALTFTNINQQLFYEATQEANAALYLGKGGKSSGDVKLADAGGYGNHLHVEKMLHNTVRQAFANRDAREMVDASGVASEEQSLFGGKELEYDPLMMETGEPDED